MNKIEVSNGVGFPGLLALVFIVLKLTGTIQWSWFWVLSPIWVPVVVALLFMIFALLMAVLTGQVGSRKRVR